MTTGTTFADMPLGRRDAWLAWANAHDWGAGAARWNADGTMHVEVATFTAAANGPDRWDVETYAATGPADLRSWAGY